MPNEIRKLEIGQGIVKINTDNGFLSLTDLWREAGADPKKRPAQWFRQESAAEFIESLARKLNVGIHTFSEIRPGRNGGTWAHWQIALAYAQWLSPEFHQLVNAAYLEWNEERRDPGLKLDRAVDAYIKRGKDREWIIGRLEGKIARRGLTDALRDAGCGVEAWYNPYVHATETATKAATGSSTKEIKESRGLAKRQPARDGMTARELRRLQFIEDEAREEIQERGAAGNKECVDVVKDIASRFCGLLGEN